MTDARVTQTYIDVIRTPADGTAKVTQNYIDVIRTPPLGTLRATQLYIEVIKSIELQEQGNLKKNIAPPGQNKDAETGDTTGWGQIDTGGPPPHVDSGNPHDGSWKFKGGNDGSGNRPWWGQTVVIDTADVPFVSTGRYEVNFVCWRDSNAVDDDPGQFIVECLDHNDEFLCGKFSPFTNPVVWTEEEISLWVPSQTRKLRFSIRGDLITGNDSDAYYDDLNWTVTPQNKKYFLLYGDAGTNVTGWTVVSGPGPQAVTSSAYYNDTSINGGDAVSSEFRRDISIPGETFTEVDAGTAEVRMLLNQGNNIANDGDLGRAYIQFLNGADAVIGSTLETAATPQAEPPRYTPFDISASMPALTRKVRFGLDMTRTVGGDINAEFSRMSVMMSMPDNSGLGKPSRGLGLMSQHKLRGNRGLREFIK